MCVCLCVVCFFGRKEMVKGVGGGGERGRAGGREGRGGKEGRVRVCVFLRCVCARVFLGRACVCFSGRGGEEEGLVWTMAPVVITI